MFNYISPFMDFHKDTTMAMMETKNGESNVSLPVSRKYSSARQFRFTCVLKEYGAYLL